MTSAHPIVTLNDGNAIPQLGFGVWEIDDGAAATILAAAFAAGFRHIDSAQAYGNEKGVGRAVRECGLDRDEVFVTSKLRTSHFPYDKARRSFDDTMTRFGLEKLDLFLLHWPAPGHDGLFVDAWKALIDLRNEGRVRSIGVSNFLPEHVRRLADETGVLPAVNQVELHPHYQQRDLRAAMAELDVAIESYSPLGRGAVLNDPVIAKIAASHGKSPAQVIIRWHLQDGLIVLPKTASLNRIAENFDVFDFALTVDDMAAIETLDKPDGKILPDPKTMNHLF
jgi:2,5-diketo-D-gluconate reductase A